MTIYTEKLAWLDGYRRHAGKRAGVSPASAFLSLVVNKIVSSDLPVIYFLHMAAPKGLEDLRMFLHSRQIDHAWLRTVLLQYLSENLQTDGNLFDDHAVWDFRNTIEEFSHILDEDPDELDDDDELED